jgi:hypothetical protein
VTDDNELAISAHAITRDCNQLLLVVSVGLLSASLFVFAREVMIRLNEFDEM